MSISVKNIDQSDTSAVSVVNTASAVRHAREAVGYSIEELAVTCGLANGEISEIENGENADPAKLKRIAAALQVPLSTFLPM